MTPAMPLLALRRQRPGTFSLLMAATCLLMVLAAALALSLRAAAHDVGDATAQKLIVQVVEADRALREATTNAAIDRLGRLDTVISLHRVEEKEARALVAPYIAGVDTRDLPLPSLIEVRTRDRAAVLAALHPLPHLQVTGAGAALRPLVRLIEALRGVATGVALAATGATGLIAMLAARAAMAREGATLEILHALGATDRQLSRLVTGKIARDAAIGAAVGLVAALAVIWMIAARVAAIGAGIDSGWGIDGWAILVLLALGLVGLATLAAQGALLTTLRRAP